MNSPLSNLSSESTKSKRPRKTRPRQKLNPQRVPRIDSLAHRVLHATDAGGQPIPLADELLFFLDNPPPRTGDRWQEGADLCAKHGITTSRMAAWRFYHAHIVEWRRDQAPPLPTPSPAEIERLHHQIRHLAALRALEKLRDPALTPGHLIGLLQNDNHRRKLQLARDQFKDRLTVRAELARHQFRKAIDKEMRKRAMDEAAAETTRRFIASFTKAPSAKASSHTTS